jgi:hypothetical protein
LLYWPGLHPGKRGKIEASEPKALTKLGLDKNHWTTRVKGIGSGYWRVMGEFGRIDRQGEGNQSKNTVWQWFGADFEQRLGQH